MPRRFPFLPSSSPRAAWLIGTLLFLAAAIPTAWLAISDLRVHNQLAREVNRGLEVDAQFFSERLHRLAEAVLHEEPSYAQAPDTKAVLVQVVPEAFRRLRASLPAEQQASFASHFAFHLVTLDTTLILNEVDWSAPASHPAVSVYTTPFDLNDRFPGWTLRILTFNEARARERTRYVVSLLPLLLVIGALVLASRLTLREVALSRTKSAFVSNVSHELKTPLTKIRFFAELLRRLPPGPETHTKRDRYFSVIDQECERLTILIDNVLDFSRIERGTAHYTFTELPVEEIVSEVIETFNVMYEEQGYRIRLDMDDDLPPLLLDPNAIKRALINLIDNAVKYSEPHTLEIRTFYDRQANPPVVAIAVRDQGTGIPRQDIAHIFDEFYRVPSHETRSAPGSGLGLALVRHIAEAHGGRVTVESTVGAGSTFTISLPVPSPKRR